MNDSFVFLLRKIHPRIDVHILQEIASPTNYHHKYYTFNTSYIFIYHVYNFISLSIMYINIMCTLPFKISHKCINILGPHIINMKAKSNSFPNTLKSIVCCRRPLFTFPTYLHRPVVPSARSTDYRSREGQYQTASDETASTLNSAFLERKNDRPFSFLVIDSTARMPAWLPRGVRLHSRRSASEQRDAEPSISSRAFTFLHSSCSAHLNCAPVVKVSTQNEHCQTKSECDKTVPIQEITGSANRKRLFGGHC